MTLRLEIPLDKTIDEDRKASCVIFWKIYF